MLMQMQMQMQIEREEITLIYIYIYLIYTSLCITRIIVYPIDKLYYLAMKKRILKSYIPQDSDFDQILSIDITSTI